MTKGSHDWGNYSATLCRLYQTTVKPASLYQAVTYQNLVNHFT